MNGKIRYCIQWTNSRNETHTGPALWARPALTDFLYDLDPENLDKIEEPRLKTYEEAQELADSMNYTLEFNNDSHEVVIFKKDGPIGPRLKAAKSRRVTT